MFCISVCKQSNCKYLYEICTRCIKRSDDDDGNITLRVKRASN